MLRIFFAFCLIAFSPPALAGALSDNDQSLNRTCTTSSDCVVMNVGNCCGYYPACLNVNATPDPKAVQAACAEQGMASVCGFEDISACACVDGQCAPAQTGEEFLR